MKSKIEVLALDLEGTLISNAMSQIPRPGLFEFLEETNSIFPRLVMYTTIREEKFREIALLLVEEGTAPNWFSSIEYVNWTGETKDLSIIPGVLVEHVLLVDDFEKYVHPDQEAQWVQIENFGHPYPDTDEGLAEVMAILHRYA